MNWVTPILDAYDNEDDFPERFQWDNCQGCSYFNFNRKKFKILDGKEQIV